jgi:hypothetical protein
MPRPPPVAVLATGVVVIGVMCQGRSRHVRYVGPRKSTVFFSLIWPVQASYEVLECPLLCPVCQSNLILISFSL